MIWLLITCLLLGVLFSALIFLRNPVFIKPRKSEAVDSDLIERLKKHLNFLCLEVSSRSFDDPKGREACLDYMEGYWGSFGLSTERQAYSADNYTFENLICTLEGNNSRRIVIGAHYDSCGHLPGADDNASAVASLLELGRLLSSVAKSRRPQIELVAYCTEESPYFRTEHMGSYIHADRLTYQPDMVIVLEMLGYFSNEPNSQEYPMGFMKWLYPRKANFLSIVARKNEWKQTRQLKKKLIVESNGLPYRSINSPFSFDGIERSDHRNYWLKGMKALMVTDTSFYRNPHYHSAEDLPETLNIPHIGSFTRALFRHLCS